jgi:hypothetical protein
MNRSEMIVSLTIAVAVTIILVGKTVAEWPSPLRLTDFQLDFRNPFAVL